MPCSMLDVMRRQDGLRLIANTTNQYDMKPPCARRKPGHRAGLSKQHDRDDDSRDD